MLLRTFGVLILAWMLVTAGESKAVQSSPDLGAIQNGQDDVWSDYHLLKSEESDNSDDILDTEDLSPMQDTEVMDYNAIEEIKEMLEHEMIDQLKSNLIVNHNIPLIDSVSDNDLEEGFDYQLLNNDESENLYEHFSAEENSASRQDFEDDNSDMGEGYDYQILNTDETSDSVTNDASIQAMDVIDYEVVEDMVDLVEQKVIEYLESNVSPLKDDENYVTYDMEKSSTSDEEKEAIFHNHEIMDYDAMKEIEEIFEHKDTRIESNLILRDSSSTGNTRDNLENDDLGGAYRSQNDVVINDVDTDDYELVSVLGGEMEMYEEIKMKINFLESLMKAHQGVGTKADVFETALETLDKESLVPFEENLNSVRGLIVKLGDKIDSGALGYIRDVLMKAELFLKDAMVKLDLLERADVEYRKQDDDGQENAVEMLELEEAIAESSSNKDSQKLNAAEIIEELEEAIVFSSSNKDSQELGAMGTNEELEIGEFALNGIYEDTSMKVQVNKVAEEIMDDLKEVISDFISDDIKNDKESADTEQLVENKMDPLVSLNHGINDGDQIDNSEMNAEKIDRRISPKFKHLFDKVKGESNPLLNDRPTTHHHEFGSTYQPRRSIWRIVWMPALAGAVLFVVLAGLLGSYLYKRRRAIGAYTWDGNFHSELVNENYDGGLCNNKLK